MTNTQLVARHVAAAIDQSRDNIGVSDLYKAIASELIALGHMREAHNFTVMGEAAFFCNEVKQ